ncbi:MFS transporter, NNP family, nitrate/nitrite transporter [Singulisphaera sp. GP187]|uniref:MFS transporter n=1 Tax=Singulisphaera sp. GP187 TaxID=1882752 RepID=UPI0009298B89|nr:MFS transporter [Singulisphaera sp. GP187]SIO24787.1 MFS transporter, NNP family, nitrate/nitrite transporter [Singulisphaera sp. GP187]
MRQDGKATRINLFDVTTPSMRAFHMSWIAFFLCFFAWFGIAPQMATIRSEMGLTKDQIGWLIIGSVAITVVARIVCGQLCDRFGPRLTYTWLLILGSLPVMGIGLAHDFPTFLAFRVAIGAIGAGFVITQYHTSVMFAPNCIGTANATTAGWGNMGGGVTQFAMPLLAAFFAATLGLGDYWGWRASMLVAGAVCMLTGVAYYFLTQDTPHGNFAELRAAGRMAPAGVSKGAFLRTARDPRVWVLFCLYAACFGVELTMDGVAHLYYHDHFGLSAKAAGFAAGSLGMLHLFARTLGGFISDRLGGRWGLKGRVHWLFVALLLEGLGLMLFSQMQTVSLAIPAMIGFGLFMKMSEGATYAVVPFVNKKALGSVSGIVGAGGNVGAVAAGFMFKGAIAWPTALFILGGLVSVASFLAFAVRFSTETEVEAAHERAEAEDQRQRLSDAELEPEPSLAGAVA